MVVEVLVVVDVLVVVVESTTTSACVIFASGAVTVAMLDPGAIGAICDLTSVTFTTGGAPSVGSTSVGATSSDVTLSVTSLGATSVTASVVNATIVRARFEDIAELTRPATVLLLDFLVLPVCADTALQRRPPQQRTIQKRTACTFFPPINIIILLVYLNNFLESNLCAVDKCRNDILKLGREKDREFFLALSTQKVILLFFFCSAQQDYFTYTRPAPLQLQDTKVIKTLFSDAYMPPRAGQHV